MGDKVLEVRNLKVEFSGDKKTTVAVDEISFSVAKGEVLGIVGESGSGKSVTSLAIMGLINRPGKITGGEIWFHPAKTRTDQPINLSGITNEHLRQYRGGEIAMIFQEPMSSLNPVYNIGFQLTEAIELHQNVTREQAKNQALSLLQEVKLLPGDEELEAQYLQTATQKNGRVTEGLKAYIAGRKETLLKRYPHELSGGQLQRVMIAMAISCNPTILIADEPTTALDVTVQAEILHLLRELCKTNREMSMIFISHDLGVINQIADSVVVMYQGKIVEQNSKQNLLNKPQHPYTKGLLACRPRIDSVPEKLPTVADFLAVEKDGHGNIIALTGIIPPSVKLITPQEEAERWQHLEGQNNILEVKDLFVQFPIKGGFGQTKAYFNAVNNISFEVKQGKPWG
jgi:peptide/nickel transport system ATP-binding protein